MLKSLWLILIVPGIPMAGFFVWLHVFIRRRQQATRRPFDEMQRPPGWSLQQRMGELVVDYTEKFMVAGLAGTLAWALAASAAAHPPTVLAIGLCVTGYFLWRAGQFLVRYSNCRLGLLGEQVVGQILDQQSSSIVRVFHDLEVREPGKRPWNIDHVVVSEAGVFAIETKCRRKPVGAAGGQKGYELVFDGAQVIFPEPMKPDRKALAQAQRNAQWLSVHGGRQPRAAAT